MTFLPSTRSPLVLDTHQGRRRCTSQRHRGRQWAARLMPTLKQHDALAAVWLTSRARWAGCGEENREVSLHTC